MIDERYYIINSYVKFITFEIEQHFFHYIELLSVKWKIYRTFFYSKIFDVILQHFERKNVNFFSITFSYLCKFSRFSKPRCFILIFNNKSKLWIWKKLQTILYQKNIIFTFFLFVIFILKPCMKMILWLIDSITLLVEYDFVPQSRTQLYGPLNSSCYIILVSYERIVPYRIQNLMMHLINNFTCFF